MTSHTESKKYIVVGLALLLLTVTTVAVRNLNLGIGLAVLIALSIATLKGSLVASFFMHLISEKKVIYVLLLSTAFLFIVLMVLILAARFDVYEGLTRVS